MKRKSMTASCARQPADRRMADHHRLAEPGCELGLGEPLAVRAQVEEGERVLASGRPRPPRRSCPRRPGARSASGRASGSGARTAHRPTASPRARRRGSATRTTGTCSDDACSGRRPARSCARSRRRSGSTCADLRRARSTGRSRGPRSRLQAERAREAAEHLGVRRGAPVAPLNPAPTIDRRRASPASSASTSAARRPARLGQARSRLGRIEHVEVERDVDAVHVRRAPRRCLRRRVRMPLSAMNRSSGGSRFRAPTSATRPGSTAPASISIRSGIPHCVARRRALRRVQVAVRVEPDDARAGRGARRAPRRRRRGRSSSRRARAAGRASSDASARFCSPSVSSSTTAASGYGQLELGGAHAPSPRRPSPQARGTRTQPGAEGAPAGVALVVRAERDGGQRAAVRALRAQRRSQRPLVGVVAPHRRIPARS